VKHIISSISWRFSDLCRSSHPAEGLVEFSFVNKRMTSEIICPHDCISRLRFHKTAIESAEQIFYNIQGVPGGMCQIREGVPYVKVHRYNPKHLYPKLNGYGDNGQRKA
jgi:hypothetical protein